jgi:hypothetical protein
MSKKQNSRKKINIKLKSNESYIVADADWFLAISDMYNSLAKLEQYKETKKELIQTAAFIKESVEQNYFDPSLNNEDEDWD